MCGDRQTCNEREREVFKMLQAEPVQEAQQGLLSSRDSQPARVFDTPRPGSSLRNTTSSATGINIATAATAAVSVGKSNHHNCDSASVQSQSLGSSVDPDDEIKAIMARAVHGLKAQEAVRFKQHMNRMETRVKQLAESHVANLQNVLQQYQVSNKSLAYLQSHTHSYIVTWPQLLSILRRIQPEIVESSWRMLLYCVDAENNESILVSMAPCIQLVSRMFRLSTVVLQESNETLEEQKKWLVTRVLQQEMESSEYEQAVADAQAQLSERESRIAALETEVRSHPPCP